MPNEMSNDKISKCPLVKGGWGIKTVDYLPYNFNLKASEIEFSIFNF
jgi:hypothetical protein